MRLSLTLAEREPDRRTDLVVDIDDDATIADLVPKLRSVAAGVHDTEGVISMLSRTLGAGRGAPANRIQLFVEGQELGGDERVADTPLKDGSLISLDDPALTIGPEPQGQVELRVVGGSGGRNGALARGRRLHRRQRPRKRRRAHRLRPAGSRVLRPRPPRRRGGGGA